MRGVLEPQPNACSISRRRLAAGDVDRIAGRAEGRDELAKRRVEIGRHRHQLEPVVDAGIREQHARAAGAGDDQHVLALGRRQDRQAARELEHVVAGAARGPRPTGAARRRRSIVAGQRRGVRARRARADRGAARLQHDHRLLARDALGDLGERAAVLQVLDMHRDRPGCSGPARRKSADRPRRYRTCCRGRRSPRRPSWPSG